MAQAFQRSFWAAGGLAMALSSCSPGPMIERLPAEMGLPSGAPARPVTPYQYPAVHDMPPARATAPLSEDELLKLEKDLQSTRDRQEAQQGTAKKTVPVTNEKAVPVTNKKAVPPMKKQPAAVIVVPPAGVKGNP